MLKLNEHADRHGDGCEDVLCKTAIAALRATQSASTFMSLQCRDYFLCVCVCILLILSVSQTHLSTFMSYFARSFPLFAQVSLPCVSSLLFSLICTSHTLITINVLDRFTACSMCVCLSVCVFVSLSLYLTLPFFWPSHKCCKYSYTFFHALQTPVYFLSHTHKQLSFSISLGFEHLL